MPVRNRCLLWYNSSLQYFRCSIIHVMKFLVVMPCRTHRDSNENNKNSNNIEKRWFQYEKNTKQFLMSPGLYLFLFFPVRVEEFSLKNPTKTFLPDCLTTSGLTKTQPLLIRHAFQSFYQLHFPPAFHSMTSLMNFGNSQVEILKCCIIYVKIWPESACNVMQLFGRNLCYSPRWYKLWSI